MLQNPTKMIFFCQEIFFFNLRSSEQKIQEHGKGALLFSSFLFFHFFQFLVSSSFIFWSLILQKQEPDRKVYVFWKEAITADLASSDSASFFEILYQGTSSVFNYGQSCQKCTTKKHLDISNADEASTGWVGIKAEL